MPPCKGKSLLLDQLTRADMNNCMVISNKTLNMEHQYQ